MKHIIEEMHDSDFSYYFDDDTYNEDSGDFNNTVFVRFDGRITFNHETFCDISRNLNYIVNEIDNLNDGSDYYKNIKAIMLDYGLKYSPYSAHRLKRLANSVSKRNETETICEYLSIKTKKKWTYTECHGYSQGDWCEVIFCEDNNTLESMKIFGELYLGCGREFCVIDLDDDGNEANSCCGYFVADCQATSPDDYKKIVCEWAGIDEVETKLKLIDGYTYHTSVSYAEY